ncbi:MAG: hypothetical protein IKT50_05705 [Clostridia bacterium]|nr:hypothetical protein [Clostridia bacterium]
MGLFDIFKKKKVELTEEQLKWNKMWELWTQEKVESPYAELLNYSGDINSGGHGYYFECLNFEGDIKKDLSALEKILSHKLNENLQKAYRAYLMLKEKDNDKNAEEILEQCDDVFYENEEEINYALEEYASKIEL